MSKNEKDLAAGPDRGRFSRRRFLTGTGAAAVSFSLIQPDLVRGSQVNSKIKLGLIGCGGRGSWIAGLFQEQSGYQLTAAADYFADQAHKVGQTFALDDSKCFSGLSGYKRLLESGVEAVAIISPPFFHPQQAAAAIAAGVHVYLAKPIAVDAPGCQLIAESGRTATAKKLCFLVDFQTRTDPFYVEALRRVHQGELGEFAFGEATYHADDPFTSKYRYLKEDPNNVENRLRAWGLDRVFSGDIITEQNIHTLDVMNWIMKEPPLSAVGTGGRKVRQFGDCWDCFTVLFQYPNQVGITFSSRQFYGHRTAEGIRNRMIGSKGVLETEYGGPVLIRSDNPYPGGKSPGIYKDGAVSNIATFHKNIAAGNYENTTVPPSVQSNLITVLGRTAAYKHTLVTWEEMLKANEKLEVDLKVLKS